MNVHPTSEAHCHQPQILSVIEIQIYLRNDRSLVGEVFGMEVSMTANMEITLGKSEIMNWFDSD
jgi:hypothetical protein